MNFSRFHQRRQAVLETKLHMRIFGMSTSASGEEELEHLRGGVVHSTFPVEKCNDTFARRRKDHSGIYTRICFNNRQLIVSSASRKVCRVSERTKDRRRFLSAALPYRSLPRYFILFVQTVSCACHAADASRAAACWKTSRGGHDRCRRSRDSRLPTYIYCNNNRRRNSGPRNRLREMQFCNTSRGEAAGTRAAGCAL